MYTSNEEYDERDVNTSNSGSHIKIIVIIVLVIILLVLLFLALKGKNNSGSTTTKDNYVLTISPQEIVVPVGKSKPISYDVRNNGVIVPNAVVNFVVNDSSIAKMDNNYIQGLAYGKTTLKGTYSVDGKDLCEVVKDVIVGDGDPNIAITNVIFPDGDLQMSLNGTYNISYTIEPSNGFVEKKVIKSSNTSIVTVDNSGLVTAVGEGEAVITIDINNGKFTKNIKVLVSSSNSISTLVVNPTGITITSPVTKMKVGETATLGCDLYPSNASLVQIDWVSSDTNVLTVDLFGKVTAVGEGTATISVLAPNNVSDDITIQVEKADDTISDITLPPSLTMNVGDTQMLVPTVVPSTATNVSLTYSSSDGSIISIVPSADTLSATISATAAGTVTIEVKSGDGSVSKTMTVIVNDTNSSSNNGSSNNGSSNNGSSNNGSPNSGTGNLTCEEWNKRVKCNPGTYPNCGNCVPCPSGKYCTGNQAQPKDCSDGYTPNSSGSACVRNSCPAGEYLNSLSSTGCSKCPSGMYCPGGTAQPKKCSTDYVPNDSQTSCVRTKCPAGQGLDPSSSTGCSLCAKGYYSPKDDGKCYQCLGNRTTASAGASSEFECICSPGYFLNRRAICEICPAEYYCPGDNKSYSCADKGGTTNGNKGYTICTFG